jgi:hypothetical protein
VKIHHPWDDLGVFILGFYLGKRLFKLYEKKKHKGTRTLICTCFGTLDRRNDISTNVFLHFRPCGGHIYDSKLCPGMQNKFHAHTRKLL